MSALPGLIVLLVGIGLLASPWWSSTLPADDYALAWVLGTIFSGFGAYVALPDAWPRSKTLAFALALLAFGAVCAALALSPFAPAADGSYVIGGVHGIRASEPMPWWARIVAGFFALVCGGAGALGVWGLLRALIDAERTKE